MPLKIKICGITTLDDALWAVEAGADLLGFNFYPPSPRVIQPQECARIAAGLRRRFPGRLPAAGAGTGSQPEADGAVTLVGVFVNSPLQTILATLEECTLDLAQLSGDEPPEMLQALGGRAFKALRPPDAAALQDALRRYPPRPAAPACLVDAYRPGQYGGTGQTADWTLARSLAETAPILLAGGLNPDNVHAAVRQVRPWGVDVASGVESAPGRKDRVKMSEFIAAARSAVEGLNSLQTAEKFGYGS